ncbi:hypothetical protein [Bradyrhizobium sp. dw_78]|uniref:hypothetical protein n=1 Tax=Bradyrhizobium sp. dw_78 TaxID=2719793 RepID=UPI001BD52DE7|nr:hypothetical protein [Bradyrhizobium sp. dw_78]
MLSEDFRAFLQTKFRGGSSGKPLTSKAAGDAVSRCKKYERITSSRLPENLNNSIKLEQALRKLDTYELETYSKTDMRAALKKYFKFLSATFK